MSPCTAESPCHCPGSTSRHPAPETAPRYRHSARLPPGPGSRVPRGRFARRWEV